jgi:hypothetical protein
MSTTWRIAGVSNKPLNLETTMVKTKNGLSVATRVNTVELLIARLAD